ncbi:MAG: dienelactone hydrolase family protein [Deltaproteobacteria bacterium]|nr:dienelactone hydrolase family protein [Deltaproteobacteria bacterium]
MKKLLLTFSVFCLLCLPGSPWAMGETPHQYQAGFRPVGISSLGSHGGDHNLGQSVDHNIDHNIELVSSVAVWYPSARKGRARYTVRVGEWFFEAERNAKPAAGRFPVILLSHDMAGHNLANHDLALALARHGFVVIAPTHYGDNFDNASAIFSAALYYHRPRQLLAALRKIRELEELRAIMDISRLGVLGSGSGAITALQLAGADLDPAAAPAFCESNPADPVFCNPWALSRQLKLPAEAADIKTKFGPDAFRPSLALPAEAAAPRPEAVGLLAPGGLFMLDKKSLAALPAPLGAVFAAEDEFFPVPATDDSQAGNRNTSNWGGLVPPGLAFRPLMRICAGVDHYSLAAPCPENMANTLPGMCGSAGEDERAEAAAERDDFFIAFFRLHLGLPGEIEAPEAAP